MKKRFIVAVDSMSNEEEKKLLDYIKENSFGWWHWINNLWLLTTYESSISPVSLRDDLRTATSGKNMIVIEVDSPTSWAGRGPNTEDKNMFEWVHNTWSKE